MGIKCNRITFTACSPSVNSSLWMLLGVFANARVDSPAKAEPLSDGAATDGALANGETRSGPPPCVLAWG